MKPINETITVSLVNQSERLQSHRDASLIAIQLKFNDNSAEVIIQNQRFTLLPSQQLTPEQLHLLTKSELALKILNTASQQIQASLVVLGDKRLVSLPKELIDPNKISATDLSQLVILSKREQGYPLPTATISQNKLFFTSGNATNIPLNIPIKDGNYSATIINSNNQLLLQLQPIEKLLSVQLSPIMQDSTKQIVISPGDNTSSTQSIIVAKNDVSQVTASWLHRLGTMAWDNNSAVDGKSVSLTHDKAARVGANEAEIPFNTAKFTEKLPVGKNTVSQTNVNEFASSKVKPAPNEQSSFREGTTAASPQTLAKQNKHQISLTTESKKLTSTQNIASAQISINDKQAQPSSNRQSTNTEDTFSNAVLLKHLTKLGLSPKTPSVELPKLSLSAALLKVLPKLHPLLLTDLAEPDILKHELTASLAFQPSRPLTSAPISQSDSIAFMFQLLLGTKTSDQLTQNKPSNRLKQYLEGLKSGMGLDNKLLETLEKNRGFENISHLASSLRLFQQSSQELNGQGFYFVLPYQLDSHTEQLEGKLEHQKDNQSKTQKLGWHLQLKFNLSSGAMLANAFVQGKSLRLELTSSSDILLQRISTFENLFSHKLSQVGFVVDSIRTHLGKVPATVLPGDHVLVKVEV